MSPTKHVPLAEQMRPQSFSELVDPEEGMSSLRKIYVLIKQKTLRSIIMWGPPGCGKTTTAHLVAAEIGTKAVKLSAVLHGVKDIRSVIAESQENSQHGHEPTLLILDEIHRLSKSQQDVLLPALECGAVYFIGATTENPSFCLNNALLSRTLSLKLSAHSNDSIEKLLSTGLKRLNESLPDNLIKSVTQESDGDARRAWTLIEYVLGYQKEHPEEDFSSSNLHEILPDTTRRYDAKGEYHYDTISAFIKSIRASETNAAIYYLARMLDAGEIPHFIARRLCIAASEDIGLADPHALTIATSAHHAVLNIGMPEARIILAHATAYLSEAKKDNRSYQAINKAIESIQTQGSGDVPYFLRNASNKTAKDLGYGAQYKNPHSTFNEKSTQSFLPKSIESSQFFDS